MRFGVLKKYHGFLYIAPWLIGFLILTAYPFCASLFYSFTNFDMFKYKFVGFENYVKIFSEDRIFRESLKLTLLYTGVSVPAKLTVALALALLIDKNVKGINAYRELIFRWESYMSEIYGALNEICKLKNGTNPTPEMSPTLFNTEYYDRLLDEMRMKFGFDESGRT